MEEDDSGAPATSNAWVTLTIPDKSDLLLRRAQEASVGLSRPQ